MRPPASGDSHGCSWRRGLTGLTGPTAPARAAVPSPPGRWAACGWVSQGGSRRARCAGPRRLGTLLPYPPLMGRRARRRRRRLGGRRLSTQLNVPWRRLRQSPSGPAEPQGSPARTGPRGGCRPQRSPTWSPPARSVTSLRSPLAPRPLTPVPPARPQGGSTRRAPVSPLTGPVSLCPPTVLRALRALRAQRRPPRRWGPQRARSRHHCHQRHQRRLRRPASESRRPAEQVSRTVGPGPWRQASRRLPAVQHPRYRPRAPGRPRQPQRAR